MIDEVSYTVSVRLMTFNHEKFIRQAMDSIMMQETDFLVEVVVGDDFSQDNTLQIVRKYRSTDRIHIRILDRKVGGEYFQKRQVLGRRHNFSNIIENCRGKYVALLDGDDYWLDPLKLKKQIDFLESNSEYALVGTGAIRVDEDGNMIGEVELQSEKDLFFNDISKRNPFVTGSICFRFVDQLKEEFSKGILLVDRSLCLYVSQFGKARNLGEIMTAYRTNPSGVHTSSAVVLNRMRTVMNLEGLLAYLADEHRIVVRRSLMHYYSSIVRILIRSRRPKFVLYCFKWLKQWSYVHASYLRASLRF